MKPSKPAIPLPNPASPQSGLKAPPMKPVKPTAPTITVKPPPPVKPPTPVKPLSEEIKKAVPKLTRGDTPIPPPKKDPSAPPKPPKLTSVGAGARSSLPKIEINVSKMNHPSPPPQHQLVDSVQADSKKVSPRISMKLPSSLKSAIEKRSSLAELGSNSGNSMDEPLSPQSKESKTKGKRPKSTKPKKNNTKAGTLRFFSSKSKTNLKDVQKGDSKLDIGVRDDTEVIVKDSAATRTKQDSSDFSRNSVLIAQALNSRKTGSPSVEASDIITPPTPSEPKSAQILSVNNTFSKSRVARVEFGPENTSKSITITTRTSPLEAFGDMMNKISKGLPPERRDTLVAKYAKYTLYRQFEDGELEQIYSDEPLLSPIQLMESTTPKFLFTDQKVDARTREGPVNSINLGKELQETHLKEEKKADNAVDEILITERKFLFDTDLILEMVLKPICDEDILPGKYKYKFIHDLLLNINIYIQK